MTPWAERIRLDRCREAETGQGQASSHDADTRRVVSAAVPGISVGGEENLARRHHSHAGARVLGTGDASEAEARDV